MDHKRKTTSVITGILTTQLLQQCMLDKEPAAELSKLQRKLPTETVCSVLNNTITRLEHQQFECCKMVQLSCFISENQVISVRC